MRYFFTLFLLASLAFAQEKNEPRRSMNFKVPQDAVYDPELSFYLKPGDATVGFGVGYFECQCLRWTVTVSGPSGVIETKSFLVKTDSLIQFKQSMGMLDAFPTVRMFKAAAADILFMGGKIGVGFDGVTYGYDYDRNFNSIFRTGAAFVANIIGNDEINLQGRSGFQFQQVQINRAPEISDPSFPQSLILSWKTGVFSGLVSATADLRANVDEAVAVTRVVTQTDMRLQVFDIADIVNGKIGLSGLFEHDPIKKEYNANPNLVQAKLYFQVDFDPVLIKKPKVESKTAQKALSLQGQPSF